MSKKGQKPVSFVAKPPKTPPAPKDLELVGRRLWRQLQQNLEFDPAETLLLTEMCRTADTIERLVTAQRGRPLSQPVLAELRAQRITYARLLACLRMPDPADGAARPQHRTGTRQPYRPQPLKVVK
jgi:hypothetical protein